MPPRRKKAAESSTRGLAAADTTAGARPPALSELERAIVADGGAVLGSYRDPLGGHWQVLASLPVDRVAPTPFQRDLSEPHVARLARVLDSLDRFLDPIIAVRSVADGDASYWTPNGNHRLSALKRLGGRSVIALVLPETELAYKILALNTERAHNLREKALEVIRMARDLAGRKESAARAEKDYAVEFEEPAFLTLGVCYEKNGRFPGGAYNPVIRRVDAFSDLPLPKALEMREGRAARVMELEEAVSAAMKALADKGFQSPYLRPFVVARVNPLRFHKGDPPGFDATLEKMIASAKKFKADSVKPEQIARAGGAPEET
jgi:ParB family chromosome partitioning protein